MEAKMNRLQWIASRTKFITRNYERYSTGYITEWMSAYDKAVEQYNERFCMNTTNEIDMSKFYKNNDNENFE